MSIERAAKEQNAPVSRKMELRCLELQSENLEEA